MSSTYRDDVMDSAGLVDSLLSIVGSRLIDTAVLIDSLKHGLRADVYDSAILSDEVLDGATGYQIFDSVQMTDLLQDQRIKISVVTDSARMTDVLRSGLQNSITDQFQATDEIFESLRMSIFDAAGLSDSISSQRIVFDVITDAATLKDSAVKFTSDFIEEELQIQDSLIGRAVYANYTVDAVQLTDSLLVDFSAENHLTSKAAMQDLITDKLTAVQFLHDMFYAEDTVLNDENSAVAWTANSDTWAMSRYTSFSFDGIAVLNGKLYAWNKHGVYAAENSGEILNACLKTGRLDFGAQLVHPTAAYFEYCMSGQQKELDMNVVTTQSGQPAVYNYTLPKEQADWMTNGRVIFGRGLRGRQFAFDCRITAESAELHSIAVEFTQTARRV